MTVPKTILATAALVAAFALPVQAAEYYIVVPFNKTAAAETPVHAALNATSLPAGEVGQAYSYDMKQLLVVTGDSALNLSQSTWAALSALPAGLSLSSNGVLSGTPSSASPTGTSFTVRATYKTASGEQSYSLVVTVPITVSLSTATLTPATAGQAYSYDLKQHLAIQGDSAPNPAQSTWSTASTLPEGLTLGEDGILSGTPSSVNEDGANFTVTAAYKTASGSQVYTIVVNGVTLQVSKLSTGLNHTCAITTEGAVKCWGVNTYGTLGNGTTTSSSVPVSVTGLSSGVVNISSGHNHTCAVTSAGAAKCWGNNNRGQLGDGTGTQRTSPVDVIGLSSGVSALSTGQAYTCAVVSGAAKCWGMNNAGQLGDNTTIQRTTPGNVIGLDSGVASISTGYTHTCAVLTSGAGKCWGENASGKLGTGTTTNSGTPVSINGVSNIAEVTLGADHTCVVTKLGAAKCWGANASGQLGNGTITASLAPVDVSGLGSGVKTISAFNAFTCAVTTDGAGKCWGANANGQLGIGTTTVSRVPVTVSGLGQGVEGLDAGGTHACAMLADGTVKCWGANTSGQVGDGTTTQKTTPTAVSSF